MDANADLVLQNFLIVKNILRYIPSKDLSKARLINDTFDWIGKIEIQERGDHVIHLRNDGHINKFMEFLEKNYPDLDQWSPYSFKIPIGDIDRNVLDKFVALVGSRIKILDLYEVYIPRFLKWVEDLDYPWLHVFSKDRSNFLHTYEVENGLPLPGDYAGFLNVTRTMPKIWHLLNHASESLLELSLLLCTDLILISGRFPEQLPNFDRLKKLNLKYGKNVYPEYPHLRENDDNLDWDHVWNVHRDDKFFKNIVERAKNMTNGHIITPNHGHSRILTEIGSIQFAKGGKPTLETKVKFCSLQIPVIRNLMQQDFNRVNVLKVQLQEVVNWQLRAGPNDFTELLHTLHDFIVNQSQSLRILSIDVENGILTPIPNFTTVRPMQPFSKLEVLELKPNEGESYKFLKQFFKGDFPSLKEFHPFYDLNDVTYIEAPNVTMPQELLEKIRKSFSRSFDNQKDNTRDLLFAGVLIAIAILL